MITAEMVKDLRERTGAGMMDLSIIHIQMCIRDRPSTYAPIIDTILAREYVVLKEKHFYPTPLGRVVVDLLKENFPNIIDVEFTAGMEKQLDQVEEGEEQWLSLIHIQMCIRDRLKAILKKWC